MDTKTDASVSIPAVTRTRAARSQRVPQRTVKPPDNSNVVITVDDARRFMERNDLLLDEFEYERNGTDPGLVLIINEEKFLDREDTREGTRRDVNELILCFQRQGFNIEKENILHNPTTEHIQKKLKEVSEMDLSDKNSLIVFFLTHGHERDQLNTYDSWISTYDIWKNFINCKTLANKPKMFVFQACKGKYFSTTTRTSISEPSDILHDDNFLTTYLGRDMLVVFATIEGNVSYRNSLTGTWFIQELCKNFSAYGRRDDVVTVITRIMKCVTGNYYHPESGVNKKQQPVFMSTLSRKFYLNRHKDRSMVLMYRNYYQDILNQVREIKEKVDNLASMM